MRLNIWADLARVFGAFAAAALVSSLIVGVWAVDASSAKLAWNAVAYFLLGEITAIIAWLAWWRR